MPRGWLKSSETKWAFSPPTEWMLLCSQSTPGLAFNQPTNS